MCIVICGSLLDATVIGAIGAIGAEGPSFPLVIIFFCALDLFGGSFFLGFSFLRRTLC